jgi:hypothetical protein
VQDRVVQCRVIIERHVGGDKVRYQIAVMNSSAPDP